MALNLYFNGMDGTDGLKGGGFSSISGRLQGTMEGEENWRSAATRQRDLQQGWPFKRMMQKWENQCDVMRSCRAEKGENSRFQHGANLQDKMPDNTTTTLLVVVEADSRIRIHLHEKSRSPSALI